MSKPTLDSIASAKAKLTEELRKLEEQEAKLIEDEASDAFLQISDLLTRYGQHLTTKQKADIASQVGSSSNGSARQKRAFSEKRRSRRNTGCPTPRRPGRAEAAPLARSRRGKARLHTKSGSPSTLTRNSPLIRANSQQRSPFPGIFLPVLFQAT